ncbi:hypothetical protein BMS3Abin05_01913 [bacterium BMS3Abin05]|nr:hypothetical protein BMS3Abin05_01913 [bacterium BMS3Abin05]
MAYQLSVSEIESIQLIETSFDKVIFVFETIMRLRQRLRLRLKKYYLLKALINRLSS